MSLRAACVGENLCSHERAWRYFFWISGVYRLVNGSNAGLCGLTKRKSSRNISGLIKRRG